MGQSVLATIDGDLVSPSCAYPLVVQGKLGTRYLVTVPEMELVLSYWGPEFLSPLDLKHVRGPG